jgi:tetratricopeptide (TPR) repeat protein
MVADIELAATRASYHYERSGFPSDYCASPLANALVRGSTPVKEAIERCRSMLETESIGLGVRFYLLIQLAQLHAMAGWLPEARLLLAESRSGLRELGDLPAIETVWSSAAANVEQLAGDPDAVERLLGPICAELRERGERAWLATHLARLGDAVYRRGDPRLALAHADDALRLAPEFDLDAQVGARCARGKALAALESGVEGERAVREALALIRPTGDVVRIGLVLVDLAEVLRLERRSSDAAEVLIEALELYAAKGDVLSGARVRAQLAELGSPYDGGQPAEADSRVPLVSKPANTRREADTPAGPP